MSLLKELLIKEEAAGGSTSAGGIANARGSLFGGGAVDLEKENRRKTKMMRRIGYVPISEVITPRQSNTWKQVYESITADAPFDSQDVISKLDAAEKKAKASKDVVAFGLEDEDGKIIKVYVRAEQADDFEAALASALAGADSDEDNENTGAEIAEVLFHLKDKYDIVDVEWGIIAGDEDEEQELEGSVDGEVDTEMGGGGELDVDAAPVDDTTDAAASALQGVIDVMRADADARKAEANADKAKADAETAKYAAASSAAKVAQEEQILDMETAEKTKKEADNEAKTLAKLAKYQHSVASEEGAPEASVSKTVATDDAVATTEVNVENEEGSDEEAISQDRLAQLLLKHMSGKK